MNWKTELEEKLAYRKRKNNADNYFKALSEFISPTFKEIEQILHEHHINSSLNSNKDELKVDGCGFSMKVELVDDKVRITFHYLNPHEPIDMPPLIDSVEKYVSIREITKDMIGEEFVEAFKPMIKYFPLSME